MNLKLLRTKTLRNSTVGILFANSAIFYTLEDTYNEFKIPGKTRIPSGRYQVTYYKNTSPMTEKYRKRFSWFDRHLEIRDVDNFTNILFHIGNTDKDTSGCILLGLEQSVDGGLGIIKKSTKAFEKFYKLVTPHLKDGEEVYLEIIDDIKDLSDSEAIEVKEFNPIMNFLKQKETEAFKNDEDKWKDFPIQIGEINKELKTYYIQDASTEVFNNGTQHKLNVILLDEKGKGYNYKKYCKAPKGCIIDWQNVQCSFSIDTLD